MQQIETSPAPRRWLRTARSYVGLWLRLTLGWFFIGLGVLGVILPILPGMPWLIIGTWLIGRRSRLFRLTGVASKRFLRRWAAHEGPVVGELGRWALRTQREASRQRRRLTWWLAERLAARRRGGWNTGRA